MTHYALMASPTLHPGQVVTAVVSGADAAIGARLLVRVYGEEDRLVEVEGPSATLQPGESTTLEWMIPETGGLPIAALGFRLAGNDGARLVVDRIGWTGAPAVTLGRPEMPNTTWRRAWIDGVDEWNPRWRDPFHLSQNAGTGLIAQGTEEWTDYRASVTMTIPLAAEAGIAVRVGGMRRWYGLLLGADGIARLVRECDGRAILAETLFAGDPAHAVTLTLEAIGEHLRGTIDGEIVLEADDGALRGGGAGLVVREGTIEAGPVTIAAH
jgi:hypothetical protein